MPTSTGNPQIDALLAQLGVSVLALDVQKADAVFLAVCATLVFVAQVGFALLEVGSVSVKNTKGILLKNVMDLCASCLAFYFIGYGLALGKSAGGGAFGGDAFAMRSSLMTSLENTGEVVTSYTRAFFAMCFSATSATIVSGAVAERCSFKGYLVMTTIISAIIFPVVLHWQWGEDGWLAPLRTSGPALFNTGALDYAGSGFVHTVGGLCALIATIVIGAREGRFTEGKHEPNVMPQQSPVFQVVGGLIMWYGWYGFTCGSIKTLAGPRISSVCRVGLIHTVGGATGAIITMAIDLWNRPNVFRPYRMIHGALCALVSVSASAAFIDSAFAVLIGVIAGVIYVSTSWLMTYKWRLDDVVDAVPIHFFGGIWGLIAASFFSRSGYLQQVYGTAYGGCGAFYGCDLGGKVFAAALIYIISICLWVTCIFTPVVLLLKKFKLLRVSAQEERVGMDMALHGGDSYPEFQTAIFNFKDKITGAESKMEMRVRQSDAAKIAVTLASLLETHVEPSASAA